MRLEPAAAPGLQLRHDDGRVWTLHPLWLRERCDGPRDMDQVNWQRLYNPNELGPALRVIEARETAPGEWRLRFSDGASGTFSAAALLDEAARDAAHTGLPDRAAWDATLSPLPVLPWTRAPAGPALLTMVTTFLRLGFVILRGVPSVSGSVLEVARAFGLPRDTNFGVMFDVRTQPDASDLAYTGLALASHTDNPYRDPVPGVQLLHCLTNRSSGGKSTLVDGLAVANALRTRDPDAYRLLSTTPVRFAYTHADTHLVDYAPMIEHDAGAQVIGIRFSPKLDFVPLMAPDALESFYRARRLLNTMLTSPEFEIRFLLEDGDLVMFDNRRLLHGRTAFDPREGLRHLQGCYIDIDAPRSLYRVLREGPRRAAAA